MNPFLPWAIVGALITVGAASTASYFVGRDHGRDACEEKQRVAEEKAAAGVQAANKTAAGKESTRQESHREITREVPFVIQAPAYRLPCVDLDGARLLDRAVAVANGEAGGREPDAAVAEVPADSGQGPQP